MAEEKEKDKLANEETAKPAEAEGGTQAAEEDTSKPLTFGKWVAGFFVSLLFALVPLGIWGAILGWLVYCDGPKDENMAKYYDIFERLNPLMGFFVFMALGFGWRLATGKARGKATMISTAIMGIVLVAVATFAHNYIMDYNYYPYLNRNYRAVTYQKWVLQEYNPWAEEHNEWVRSGAAGDRQIEVLKSADNEELREIAEIDRYKKWYYDEYNEWAELKDELAPKYNEWAKQNGKETWKPSEKHKRMPRTVKDIASDLPVYISKMPERMKAKKAVSKNYTLVLAISIVVWISGLILAVWINRRYVSKEEIKRRKLEARKALAEARKAARQRSRPQRPARKEGSGDEKEEEKPSESAEKKEDEGEKKEDEGEKKEEEGGEEEKKD